MSGHGTSQLPDGFWLAIEYRYTTLHGIPFLSDALEDMFVVYIRQLVKIHQVTITYTFMDTYL